MASAGKASAPTERELTAGEFCLLALTNPVVVDKASRSVTLTAKDSYLWGTLIAYFADNRLQRELIPRPAELIGTIHTFLNAERLHELLPGQLIGQQGRAATARLFKNVAKNLLNLEDSVLDVWFEGAVRATDQAYSSLISRGLIEDPFPIAVGGITLVVMGFVPVSFTKHTARGQQLFLRITAPFWELERVRAEDGETTTDIRFHLFRLARALQAAALTGFQAWEQQGSKPARTKRLPPKGH
jgi:hypothetical protein